MTPATNFDLYLEEQLKDPNFAERYERAGEAWDVALQLTSLREEAGLSQTELARRLRTTQQQISRLESPSYEGHSLSMLPLSTLTNALSSSEKIGPSSPLASWHGVATYAGSGLVFAAGFGAIIQPNYLTQAFLAAAGFLLIAAARTLP